jgi:integrase
MNALQRESCENEVEKLRNRIRMQGAMRAANKAAGLEGITPHHLRHAWATHAHREGACMRDLQEILGHRDPKTTAKYISPNPSLVKSPLESLDIAI